MMLPTADEYARALPFPHAVVDGMFDDDALLDAVGEFPVESDGRWFTFDGELEQGKQQLIEPGAVWTFPAVARVLDILYSPLVVAALERMTGIDGLIPDVVGGGMHQTRQGGFLGMHVDSATDFGDRTMFRRLNVLLYLNRAWQYIDGGELILARLPEGSGAAHQLVVPGWNRLVVFDTNAHTWHGHPRAWMPAEPRRSLAVYYYTEEMPVGFDPERETTFVNEPLP